MIAWPKESIRCSPYPNALLEDVDDDQVRCRFCGYEDVDVRQLLDHIRTEHPVDEIECKSCKSRTRMEKADVCDECKEDAERELTKPAPMPARDDVDVDVQDKHKEEVEKVTKPRCKRCGALVHKGRCKGSKNATAKQRETTIYPGGADNETIAAQEIEHMATIMKLWEKLSQAGQEYLEKRL